MSAIPAAIVTVPLAERAYSIHVGAGLLADAASYRDLKRGSNAVIVSNETVGPLYAGRLSAAMLADIVALIPDAWLDRGAPFASVVEQREAYLAYLTRRLEAPRAFVATAIEAREALQEGVRHAR